MRTLRCIGAVLFIVVSAVYLMNASWLAPKPDYDRSFIAHRGVHQVHRVDALENDTCTATMIRPSQHAWIENTLPSIQAAFAAGADVVEIDIHPTTDGDFAVFHDWTVDCRTDGSGRTRDHTMASLRALDAGFGYTSDQGASYPLRGSGLGLIPSLGDVLEAFPHHRFLINFKGGREDEADRLSGYLNEHDADLTLLMVYGAEAPVARMKALHPTMVGSGRLSMRRCALGYLATGWFGRVPTACENSIVFVPRNYARLMWGWPNRFQQRINDAGSEVWLIGDWDGQRSYTTGLDDPSHIDALPSSFSGGIWTNMIETTGPVASQGS